MRRRNNEEDHARLVGIKPLTFAKTPAQRMSWKVAPNISRVRVLTRRFGRSLEPQPHHRGPDKILGDHR